MKEAVAALGDMIGFGRMMQLAQQCWREALVTEHGLPPGGEFQFGPCVAMTVACPHSDLDDNGHCPWCCGSGWVTKRVLQAMKETK